MENRIEERVQEAREALLVAQSKLRSVVAADQNKRQQWAVEMALEDIAVHLHRLAEEFPGPQP
jgi:hypothetical protein